MLPQIAPAIADALAQAKMVTICNGGEHGAPGATTNNITSVIQTVLAAQLVSRGLVDNDGPGHAAARQRPSCRTPVRRYADQAKLAELCSGRHAVNRSER